MALLKYLYLRKEEPVRECSARSKRETEQVNERVKQVLVTAGKKRSPTRGSYADYTPEHRAKIGKYAAENGPARATRHFSVPETTGEKAQDQIFTEVKDNSLLQEHCPPLLNHYQRRHREDLYSLASN